MLSQLWAPLAFRTMEMLGGAANVSIPPYYMGNILAIVNDAAVNIGVHISNKCLQIFQVGTEKKITG